MPKIDLGKKLSDSIHVERLDPDKPNYPDLFLPDVEDPALADMPNKGECTIKYRVVSRTHRQEKGKKDSCSLRLEILSIEPPAKAKKKNGDSDGGARKALSDYFKDK